MKYSEMKDRIEKASTTAGGVVSNFYVKEITQALEEYEELSKDTGETTKKLIDNQIEDLEERLREIEEELEILVMARKVVLNVA